MATERPMSLAKAIEQCARDRPQGESSIKDFQKGARQYYAVSPFQEAQSPGYPQSR